jgi:hypothetical protein
VEENAMSAESGMMARQQATPKRPCKKCHGSGVIVGKTGVPFDCDCVRTAARKEVDGSVNAVSPR